MEKLSSGLRINRAGDDAAGLAISEKMRGQIRGLDQASRNASDGISLIQTAEGALNETHNILQRMRELAVQSSNDTNTSSDREEIQKEINQLTNEIDRISNSTEFNTQKLLNGEKQGLRDSADASIDLQNNSSINGITAVIGTGADAAATNVTGTITITRVNADAGAFGDGATGSFVVSDPSSIFTSAATATADKVAIDATATTLTGTIGDGTGKFTVNDADGNAVSLADIQVGESVTLSFKAYDEGNDDVSKALSMQIGANSGQKIFVGIDDMSANALNLRVGQEAIDVSTADKASAAITTINNAIEQVSAQRSDLGSYQNRLEHTISNLDNSSENLSAAESRVRDVDMAKEMMEMTRANILSQASQSMLAQAQQQPQSVLQLLQ